MAAPHKTTTFVAPLRADRCSRRRTTRPQSFERAFAKLKAPLREAGERDFDGLAERHNFPRHSGHGRSPHFERHATPTEPPLGRDPKTVSRDDAGVQLGVDGPLTKTARPHIEPQWHNKAA